MFGPKSDTEKLEAKVAGLESAIRSIAAYVALLPSADKILPPIASKIAKEVRFRAPSFSPLIPGEVEAQTANSIQELALKYRDEPRIKGD